MFSLGVQYRDGTGVDKNSKWAALMFHQVADSEEGPGPDKINKFHMGEAIDELGRYDYDKQNYAEAAEWWLKAKTAYDSELRHPRGSRKFTENLLRELIEKQRCILCIRCIQ